MDIGVLALQGAFREHRFAFERLGANVREVRVPAQLDGLSGLVIPGGESTTMSKLIDSYGLRDPLREFHDNGGSVWGTCAGAINVASEIVGRPQQPRLGLLDIAVERNSYGRQVASFETDLDVVGLAKPFHALFIRAPRIAEVGPSVRILASYAGDPVLVRSDRVMASVFHPELSDDDRIHEYFLRELVSEVQAPA